MFDDVEDDLDADVEEAALVTNLRALSSLELDLTADEVEDL